MQSDNFIDITGKNTLDCLMCTIKHLTKAKVLFMEYIQNSEFKTEFLLGVGNLACAEDHLLSALPEYAKICREIRLAITSGELNLLSELDDIIFLLVKESEYFDWESPQAEEQNEKRND